MIHARKVAVVVPARNEAPRLEAVLRGIPGWVDDILVVDDGSTDPTGAVARAVGGRVRVARHPTNLGVGAAIRTGYREAARRGAFAIAVMAGDGQMLGRELWRVVGPVVRGEADYVKGDRLSHPLAARVMPWIRRWGSTALTLMTRRVMAWPGLRDAQCGFTALRADLVPALELDTLYPRYGYPNDLLCRLAAAGARLAQRTVTPVYRGEPSGLRVWKALFTHTYVLIRAWLRMRRKPAGTPQGLPEPRFFEQA
jgi:glycosyltransferase involved in cell wall biosynthesis